MTSARRNRARPYSGYGQALLPAAPDDELTRVGPGTPCGEYLRRFWHPVCHGAELRDTPHRLRILGEDLVAFRDSGGRVGLLHLHCCHRRASLEYGRIEARGLRCCYHGWLFDVDGRVLEMPAEPAESRLPEMVSQGAYPTREFAGLVFAYFGPPDDVPDFPLLDTFLLPGERLVPYSVRNPCNWLQIFEQGSDPVHAVILHSRISGTHFAPAWGEMPELDYLPTADGAGIVVRNLRRWGEFVWVCHLESLFPNCYQVPDLFQAGDREIWFSRASITAWIVAVDDTHSILFGLRHYGAELDLAGKGDSTRCGIDTVDFVGQTGNRSYAEAQAAPNDYEVLSSQGRIAVHARETLARSDVGVALIRKGVRQGIRRLKSGKDPIRRGAAPFGAIPTLSGDVIFRARPGSNTAPDELRRWGTLVGTAVADTLHLPHAERQAAIRAWVQRAPA
ncbi:MAG: aromatic ring-hydroxylating dioxygenase subunit alpha [Alphaproteobacteria bacterium]|nr:aromatic ring-hydroxylating dioxygenase subunit alpha [Alphaproteobacteria bacterium]